MSVGHHDDEAIALGKRLGITYEAYSPLGPYCPYPCPHPKPVLSNPTVLQIANAHNRSAHEPQKTTARWRITEMR